MWISVKVFPGVRVGGRIGGRKRRRGGGYRPPRKPWPKPVKYAVGFGAAAFAVVAWITDPHADQTVSPGADPTAPTTSAGQVVRRADVTPWPLVVDSVTLACVDHQYTSGASGGVVYALNSAASMSHRWPDFTPLIIKPTSDERVAAGIVALVDVGDKLC